MGYLISCVKNWYVKGEAGEHLCMIDAALNKVAMKIQTLEAEDCVWPLHSDYKIEWENSGYGVFTVLRLPIDLTHNIASLKAYDIETKMGDIIRR